MPDPIDLGFAVKLPPRRAIRYFKAKGYAISWNWWEVWQEAHAKAFTVAKATRLDVLHTLRGALQRALNEGMTERAFARDMEPALKKLGWWGRQVVVGEQGEAELVQLGNPYRLKTIFRTNMNTSYAAARFRQQFETADIRPYWQYLAMGDARTRPGHAALNGQVFRHDDPFWNSHYPPNGWNCRCRVRALTAEQVKERGLKIRAAAAGSPRSINTPASINAAARSSPVRGPPTPAPMRWAGPSRSPPMPAGATTRGGIFRCSIPWDRCPTASPGSPPVSNRSATSPCRRSRPHQRPCACRCRNCLTKPITPKRRSPSSPRH